MKKADLENGYAKISNQIVDKLCSVRLSGYESQVLWCVIRKTYGWNKKEDWIAGTIISEMTGIKLSHVSRTVKSLKEKNIVTKNGNKIKINTNTSSWLPKMVTKKKLPKMVSNVTKNGNELTKNGNKMLPKMGYTKDNKDTNTKDTKQKKRFPKENDIEKIDIKKIMIDYNVPEAFVLSKWDDLVNHCFSRNAKYMDFNRALRGFVKRDAIKIRKEQHGQSKIDFFSEDQL